MPFTPSHIAAVLPLVRTPLAPAALVIGSMVPDLPYFVPIGITREFSHSLQGAVIADLPMGIVCLVLWAFVLRAPLVDFAPRWVHDRFRMPPRWRVSWRGALLVLASLLIGIATHLAWDAFTHPDGWVVLHVAFFREQAGPFAVSRWAQYGSSVFGLVVLAIWAVFWVRRTASANTPYRRTRPVFRIAGWVAVSAVLVTVAIAVWLHGTLRGVDAFNRGLVYDVAVFSIACAGLLALLICLVWYLLPKRDHTERSTATTLPSTSA